LAEKILELHASSEKRSTLGIAARKFVEENFDIRKIARQYQSLYQKI
jgi:glycosyltransferase involved in cell wall biosynthesis